MYLRCVFAVGIYFRYNSLENNVILVKVLVLSAEKSLLGAAILSILGDAEEHLRL